MVEKMLGEILEGVKTLLKDSDIRIEVIYNINKTEILISKTPKNEEIKGLEGKSQGDIEEQITQIMKMLGVPANVKGYEFLRDAILICYNDTNALHVSKVLYPVIAKKREIKPASVERSIRFAIEKAFDRGDIEIFEKYFGNSISPKKGKTTNGEFIVAIVDYLRVKNKNSSK